MGIELLSQRLAFFSSNTISSHVNNISALDKIIIMIIVIIIIHCHCMHVLIHVYFCRHAGFCFFLAGFSFQSTYDPGLVLTVFITYCTFIAQTIPQTFYRPTTKSISFCVTPVMLTTLLDLKLYENFQVDSYINSLIL